jgi:O-antigen/teichoic acid export membrane protein
MALKELFKQSAGYGIIGILSKSIRLLLIPIYTRYLHPADYGLLEITLITMSTLSVFGSTAMNYSVGLLFYDKEEVEYKQRLITTGIIGICIGSLIISALFWLFYQNIGDLLVSLRKGQISSDSVIPDRILWLMVVLFPLSTVCNFIHSVLRVKLDIRRYMFYGLLEMILMAVTSVLAVLVSKEGERIYNIYYYQLFAEILLLLVGFKLIAEYLKFKFSKTLMKQYAIIGLPILPYTIISISQDVFNRYYLASFSLAAVGYFAVASKISVIIKTVTQPVMSAWGPWVLSIKNQKDAKGEFNKAMNLGYSLWFLMTALTCLWGKEVYYMFVNKTYYSAWPAIIPCCLSVCFYGLAQLQQLGIHITKKTYYLPVISLLSLIFNVFISIMLVAKHSYLGIAWAMAVGNLSYFFGIYYVTNKEYPMSLKPMNSFVFPIILVLVVGLSYLFPYFQQPLIINILLKLIITSLLFLIGIKIGKIDKLFVLLR